MIWLNPIFACIVLSQMAFMSMYVHKHLCVAVGRWLEGELLAQLSGPFTFLFMYTHFQRVGGSSSMSPCHFGSDTYFSSMGSLASWYHSCAVFMFQTTHAQIRKRGSPPLGGGEVMLTVPIVKQLTPIDWTDAGRIKRVRGVA